MLRAEECVCLVVSCCSLEVSLLDRLGAREGAAHHGRDLAWQLEKLEWGPWSSANALRRYATSSF